MATSRKRNVEIDVVVDDKNAKAKLKGVGDEAGKMGGKASLASRGVDTLKGAFSGLVAVMGVREIAEFAVDAAKMAEQAAIAGESAEKVLGPALEGLHERLEETRLTLGLNSAELDTLVAKFGLLSEGFGLSDEAQAEFIENLIITGGELAAFRGNVGEAPEAIDALGAALRGEFDPLEQFGVKLSQSAINERKLQLAADPATSSLSDQELQILALQQLITEKAEPALGSLADAQDTLAGKTNEANAKFEDLKIELGEKLLPVLSDATEELIAVLDVMDGAPAKATSFRTSLQEVIEDFREWADGIKAAIEWLDRFLDDLKRGEGVINDFNEANSNRAGGSSNRNTGGGSGGGTGGGKRRASGGSVLAGETYLVGEDGPEPFIPATNGTILPNDKLGGSTFVFNVSGFVGDEAKLARELQRLVRKAERALL